MSFYDATLNETIIADKVDTTNKQLPWIEKYRPKQIDQIISHREIIQSLKKFICKKTLPHLLFFGPSGSGKTSAIKCCAAEIYGQYTTCMILELNASNERGIETVRTKIKNFVSNKNSIFLPMETRGIFKLVILDEIDSMTVEAQGMLRQTIEKNSSTTRFCLICNDIDKINMALQSRCTLFHFAPLSADNMKTRLIEICVEEKIKYNENAIDAITKISHGDMRSAINTLQHAKQTSFGKLTIKSIYKISGHCMPEVNIDIFNKLMILLKGKTTLDLCSEEIIEIVINNNITIFNLLDELNSIVMKSSLKTKQKIFIIDHFAKSEIYDSVNVDPTIIIMNICSLFVVVSDVK